MSIEDNNIEPVDRQAIYSQRAADFHGLVTGWRRDEDALEQYMRLVRAYGEGGAIIDVGCGTGDVLNDLSTTLSTTRLVGVDVVDEMLAIGRKDAAAGRGKTRGSEPEFVRGDMHTITDELPELRGAFDLAISRWTYHHSKDLSRIFQVASSLLKPNGWHVFLSNVVYSWNESCPIETFEVQLTEDFSVTNYALALPDYMTSLADNRFLTSDVALYSADHKIIREPRELWFRDDGLPSVGVFTGVFAAQLMS